MATLQAKPRFQIVTRQGLKRLAVLFGVIAIGLLYGWWSMIRMPGESFRGVLPAATSPFRNGNYHKPSDTPDTLDYERMARVVEGLERVLGELAGTRSAG